VIEEWLHVLTLSFTQLAVELLDIIVVAALIYRGLLVLRGTRAVQMGFGIVFILLTYLAARWIGLVTLENLFSYLLSSIILIIIVVFQNDIRRALMRIGSNPLFGVWGRALEARVVDEVVAATTELARHRTGALITFEQDANLDEFVVGQGTSIDAAVTKELLVTMFIPESMNKLHDGAVIIRNLRIAKAGVFFPMPEAKNVDAAYGSRHRAAIGITEETDAVVIVVSEERGTISFCFNGNIVTDLDGEVLRKTLLRIFGRAQKKPVLPDKKKGKRKGKGKGQEPVSRVAIATPPPPRASAVPRAPAIATPMKVINAPDGPRSTRDISTPMAPTTSTPTSTGPGETH
jgi:diadenylate cyclase